jgi:hypothetical protein
MLSPAILNFKELEARKREMAVEGEGFGYFFPPHDGE